MAKAKGASKNKSEKNASPTKSTSKKKPTVDHPSAELNPEQLAVLATCEKRLDYRFRDKSILFEALTHSSSVDRRLSSYERMEFLGDSILGFIVCEYLFLNYPQWDEGDLTKVKSTVVSRQTCSEIGVELGLEEFLSVGKGIGSMRKVPASLLANAFEALVAAIYLDGGLKGVRTFLQPIIVKQVNSAIEGSLEVNYKSELQHYVQKRFGVPPVYIVLGSTGPDHEKKFQIAAQVIKRIFQPAWGKNKKEAEQRAAANALAAIAGKAPPFAEG